jgi:hypothetical protein
LLQVRKKGMSGAALIAIALVIILALAGAYYVWTNYDQSLVGSGNIISRQFTVPGFTSVSVEDGFTVNISYADYFMVRVTTDDNIMSRIDVTSVNGTLHVGVSEGAPIARITALKLEVYMPAMTGIDFSNGTNGALSSFPMQTWLSMALSNASSLNITQAVVGSFYVSLSSGSVLRGYITCGGGVPSNFALSGGSSVTLSGIGGDIIIDATGGSSLDLLGMAANDVTAAMSGGSSAKVNMDGTLNANLSGGSSLRYTGSPTMGSIVLTGGSSVNPM